MTEFAQGAENEASRFVADPTLERGGPTSLSLRLWSLDTQDVTWSSEHAVVCMVADLLKASEGQLVDEAGNALMAQFDEPKKAIQAAQRLQKALYAFADSEVTAGFGASIIIHRPEDRLRLGLASDTSELLWPRLALPGQILVSSTSYEILQFTPGLQFRAILSSDDPHSVFQELLWADPELIKAWQGRVAAAAQLAQSATPHRETDLGPIAGLPESAASTDRVTAEREPGREVPVPSTSRKTWRLRLVFALGSLALAAIVGIRYLSTSHPHQAAGTKKPKNLTVIQQPAITQPVTAQGADHPSPPKPPEKQEVQPQRPQVPPQNPPPKTTKPRPSTKPRITTPEPEVGLSEYEGFVAKQIPQLLRRAEADAGAGNYEAAKREYDIVLKLEPSNAVAKEGLRKLSLKIGEGR